MLKKPTVVWSESLELDNWFKVPRILFYLGHHGREMGRKIKARHILLILALAARKYRDKPIRVHWETLACELGVNKDTVRKWAYQLKEFGLLNIKQHRGRDPEKNRPGVRNEKNTFDIRPFGQYLVECKSRWEKQRAKQREGSV